MDRLVFIGDLDVYKKERYGKRSRQYNRLLQQAKRYRVMELPKEHPKKSTTYMGIAILNLALAYRLSEDETYLKEARRFMDAVLSYEKWGNAHLVNVDLSASWILFGLSLGYDWLKPFLTEEECRRIVKKIRHHGEIIYQYRKDTYGKGWSTNFYQNHNWINMTGLAAAGYVLRKEGAETEEEALRYIEEAKENFSRVFSYLAEDGSNYEGTVYWRYGGMWLFVYAHLLKTQEGYNYFQKSSYLKNTFYYRLYQSCGDLKQQMNFGDCHDRFSGHTPCVYYKTAAEYGDGFAQKFGNLVIDEFLMEEAENSKVKPGILPEAVFEYLWYDPKVEEKELSLLPLSRYFDDLGLLTIRNSWMRDARVLTIKCGAPGGKKQWQTGWSIDREEGIQCLSLSHHHPDNLSYIFAEGGDYLTCEDGYNRNIMPDNHNVLLVDGRYTDAAGVNDVYMESVRMRLKADPSFDPQGYGGTVTGMQQDGSVVIYRGETSGVYPAEQSMKEVSRLLFTDGLKFWVFVDVFRSDRKHRYQVISNTDPKAQGEQGSYVYRLGNDHIYYNVFSNKAVQNREYTQNVESVMTTQEPDQVCTTSMNTLVTESCFLEKEQIFYECFTFDEESGVSLEKDGLTLRCDEAIYRVKAGTDNETGRCSIEIQVGDDRGVKTVYYA